MEPTVALSYKALPFHLEDLKAASSEAGGGWEFSGYASTYGGPPDEYGDVVLPGAFDESLKRRPKPKLLWQHDLREPIGIPLRLQSDEKGLHGTWRIVDTARGSDAYKLLKAGAQDSLSIGYVTTESEFSKDGDTRLLKAVDLLEVSIVSIPANERARVTSVKSEQPLASYWLDVTDTLITATARAEALWRRRASEQREPSDAQVAALKQALAQVSACALRLDELVRSRDQARADAKAMDVRLELARRRLHRLGVLDRAGVTPPDPEPTSTEAPAATEDEQP